MTKKYNILIVDDEPIQCKVLGKFIDTMGHDYIVMNSGQEVVDFFINRKVIKNTPFYKIDVMLLDLSMPDLDGVAVLKQISAIRGDLQIIVLTAHNDVSLAINAINCGASDYIIKGDKDTYTRVIASINNALERKNLKYQLSHLERRNKDRVSFSDIIGKSEQTIAFINLAKRALSSSIPVLLEGPSGSGKKLLAMAIHGSGPRSGKPFIVVECDLLRNQDAEEELFGSSKPTSEGVVKNIGKIREANNGTIFLRKIDSLKPDLQAKLLHFLQEGEVTPLHSKDSIKVNTRLIASTEYNLEKSVTLKKFRKDLYYRVAAFFIRLPSLKERGEVDIKLLSENFFHDFSTNENKKIKGIAPEAFDLLCDYDWEGNIRQLKNTIFRAVILCDKEFIEPEHLLQLLNKQGNSHTKSRSEIKRKSGINSELIDVFDDEGQCKSMDIIEEEIIGRLVGLYSSNLSEVAKNLDIGRSTIYRKLKILGSKDEKS